MVKLGTPDKPYIIKTVGRKIPGIVPLFCPWCGLNSKPCVEFVNTHKYEPDVFIHCHKYGFVAVLPIPEYWKLFKGGN